MTKPQSAEVVFRRISISGGSEIRRQRFLHSGGLGQLQSIMGPFLARQRVTSFSHSTAPEQPRNTLNGISPFAAELAEVRHPVYSAVQDAALTHFTTQRGVIALQGERPPPRVCCVACPRGQHGSI